MAHYQNLGPGGVTLRTKPGRQRIAEEAELALGTPEAGRWVVRWKWINIGVNSIGRSATVKYASELDAYCRLQANRGGFDFEIARWEAGRPVGPADTGGPGGVSPNGRHVPRTWRKFAVHTTTPRRVTWNRIDDSRRLIETSKKKR